MKSLLAHEKTEDELTTYLASKNLSEMLRQMTSVLLLLEETKSKPHIEKLKASQTPNKKQIPN